MQTFISDIIPKIQQYSQKLDDLTLLTNQHWVVIDEIDRVKNVYIFRKNNELLISSNGEVEKGRWEYLGNNSLLIDKKDKSFLFKHGFFDENILALKIDGRNEYAFLINENKYNGELNSISRVLDFLNRKYLDPTIKKELKSRYDVSSNKTAEQIAAEKKKRDDEEINTIFQIFAIILIVAGATILICIF